MRYVALRFVHTHLAFQPLDLERHSGRHASYHSDLLVRCGGRSGKTVLLPR